MARTARIDHRGHVRVVLPVLLASLALLGLGLRLAPRPAGHACGGPCRHARAIGTPVAALPHRGWVSYVTFSPDGRWLATGSEDRTARIWDARTGTLVTTLGGHGDWVDPVVFSPDGRHVATCSADRKVRLWELPSGSQVAVLQGHRTYVLHAAWSPNGATLVTVGDDDEALFWSMPDGRPLGRLSGVGEVLFTAAGPVARRSDGSLGTISLPSLQWRAWPGNPLAFSVVGSHDGPELVAREKGGDLGRYAPDGRRMLTRRMHSAGPLAVSPDGGAVAAWAQGTVTVDGAPGSDQVARLPLAEAPVQLALSPNGRYVAAADADHQVWVWNLQTDRLVIHRATGPRRGREYVDLEVLAFSPDGHRFAAAGTPRQADLWRLP